MKAKHMLSGVAAALMAAGVYANDPSYGAQNTQNAPNVETGSQLEGAAGQGEVSPRNPDYGTTGTGAAGDAAGTTGTVEQAPTMTGSELEGYGGQGEVTPRRSELQRQGEDIGADSSMSYDDNNGVQRKREMDVHPAGSTGSSFGGLAGDGEVSTFPEKMPGYENRLQDDDLY